MVDVKLASKAATASTDKVCENDSGGNGTDPGAGATREGYGYLEGAYLLAASMASFQEGVDPLTAETAACAAAATADVCWAVC
jgi:hypothetical protein